MTMNLHVRQHDWQHDTYHRMEQEGTHWFRFRDYSEYYGGSQIVCDTYRVIRHTPKGVWLDDYGKERWVSKESRKRFAYPTRELAKQSFYHRKVAQVRILKGRLQGAESAIEKFHDVFPSHNRLGSARPRLRTDRRYFDFDWD